MAWNLPPGTTDADIDRAFGGNDYDGQVLELNSWHAKHQKLIDNECDHRQAELDAWYDKATKDLEAEYVEEMANIGPSEPEADELRDARIDWEMDKLDD